MGVADALTIGVVIKGVDQISGFFDGLQGKLKGLGGFAANVTAPLAKFGAMAAASIATLGGAAVNAAIAPEQAMNQLQALGIQNLAKFGEMATEVSNSVAGKSKADALNMAAGLRQGLAGISEGALAEMTKLALVTGKATQAGDEAAKDAFSSTWRAYRSLYKNMTDLQFGEAISGSMAGVTQVFGNFGPAMAKAFAEAVSPAAQLQFGLEEVGTAVGFLGDKAGELGPFLTGLEQKFREVGAETRDAANNVLPLKDMLKSMSKQGIYQGEITAANRDVLKSKGWSDSDIEAYKLLRDRLNDWDAAQAKLSNTMQRGRQPAQDLAKTMQAGFGEQMTLFGQQIGNLASSMGAALLPALTKAVEWFSRIVVPLQAWAAKNAGLVQGLFAVGGGLGLVVAGLVGLSLAASVFGGAMTAIKGIITAVTAVTKLFNLALLANPMTLVIMGAIAAIALLIIYWDDVAKAASEFWDKLTSDAKEFAGWFVSAWDFIDQSIGSFLDSLGVIGTALRSYGTIVWELLTWPFKAAWAFISTLFTEGPTAAFQALIDSLTKSGEVILNAIIAPFAQAWEWIAGKFGKIGSWFANLFGGGKQEAPAVETPAPPYPGGLRQREAEQWTKTNEAAIPNFGTEGDQGGRPYSEKRNPYAALVAMQQAQTQRTENQIQLTVDFNNAPTGMRIRPAETSGQGGINVDVGMTTAVPGGSW